MGECGETAWHQGFVKLHVDAKDYMVSIIREFLHGTAGEILGFLHGLEFAAELNYGSSWDSSVAKANEILHLECKKMGMMRTPMLKLYRKRIRDTEAFVWTMAAAPEDSEVAKMVSNFDWLSFGEGCGAKRKVTFCKSLGGYARTVDAADDRAREWAKNRTDTQLEGRSVMIFGAKYTQDPQDTDKLCLHVTTVLQNMGLEADKCQIELRTFESQGRALVIQIVTADKETAGNLAMESEAFVGLLGRRISMRVGCAVEVSPAKERFAARIQVRDNLRGGPSDKRSQSYADRVRGGAGARSGGGGEGSPSSSSSSPVLSVLLALAPSRGFAG